MRELRRYLASLLTGQVANPVSDSEYQPRPGHATAGVLSGPVSADRPNQNIGSSEHSAVHCSVTQNSETKLFIGLSRNGGREEKFRQTTTRGRKRRRAGNTIR